ncbi:MAG: hypothetical protein B7Y25_01375 [Alphaproteobacteria bacterium 16-39-46]|nr:MAG: hypothetical protein B7Y25_01375 [Alphaproteobacteria bacterium 16-39-46]OZA42785.1 MAG: hypothetical protein B7X84_04895 [Alphaproteobacteria bacterium 17-39-52]HQS84289.1 hypothetical protein [Alphaproteobacteria bacterium]HQS94139.1 hypothetical protein [Alphaproteobacteria bacterium]
MKVSLLKGIFLLCVMLTGMWGASQVAQGVLLRRLYEEDEEGRRRGGGKSVYGISDGRRTYARTGYQNFTVGSWTHVNSASSSSGSVYVHVHSSSFGPDDSERSRGG